MSLDQVEEIKRYFGAGARVLRCTIRQIAGGHSTLRHELQEMRVFHQVMIPSLFSPKPSALVLESHPCIYLQRDKMTSNRSASSKLPNTCGIGKTFRPHTLSALALLVALVGCTTSTSLDPSRYIMVHSEGYPLDLQKRPLTSEAFQQESINPILKGIDTYTTENKQPLNRLLIFVHGGLDTYKTGFEQVEALVAFQQYQPSSYLSGYHILTINWDGSFLDSLGDDLAVIRRGEPNLLMGIPTSPFVFADRLVSSVIETPRALMYQMENAFDSLRPSADPTETLGDHIGIYASYLWLYPIRVVTLPFIQGYGTATWDMLKRRDELVFAPPGSLRQRDFQRYGNQGAGRTLIQALEGRVPEKGKWRRSDGTVVPLEIILVGHSMGALVLDRLLQAAPNLSVNQIIYLAAASSLEDFDRVSLPYLKAHPETRFWSFSLSDKDETREKYALDLIERGSLLVWIDNFFERVNTPLQRRLGRYRNYARYYSGTIQILPQDLRSRICMFQHEGIPDAPRQHAEFNNPEKLERTLKIVQAGSCQ